MAGKGKMNNTSVTGQETQGRAGKAAAWLESLLSRKVGSENGSFSWGLVFLLLVAAYAVYQIIYAFVFFVK